MRRCVVLLALCAGVTVAREARASPSARLVYARTAEAASCPDESVLRRAVAARFGYDPFFAWARRTVVVQVWREGNRFGSRVQLVDERGVARGTRELTSDQDSCAELFDATALAISIALDASTADDAPSHAPVDPAAAPSTEATAPSPPPASAAPTVESPASPPPPSSGGPASPDSADRAPTAHPSGRLLFAGVDALGSLGTAPSPTAGLSLYGGLRTGVVSIGLELRADAPASKSVVRAGGAPDGTVTSSLYELGLVPCAHYRFASLCAVGELGWLQASGGGVTSPRSEGTVAAAAGGRIAFDWPMSERFSLRLHGDVVAELLRPELDLDGSTAWRPAVVAGTLGAGVLARFP